MVSMICILILVWIVPVVWVAYTDTRTRRKRGQAVKRVWLVRKVVTGLRWPLRIFAAVRGQP